MEHHLLLKELDTVNKYAKIFGENGKLEEHIQLFNWTDVVIEPHGVGVSILVFCKPKTLVIEIEWDGKSAMEMDNMYSRVAAALNLNYKLIIGKGSYGSSISLNPIKCHCRFEKKPIYRYLCLPSNKLLYFTF